MKRVAVRLLCALACLVCLAPAAPAAQRGEPARSNTKSPYVSALVIDAETGEPLFADNIDAPVYPASVLKLMDLYIVLKEIEAGRLKADDMVQITKEAADMGGSQVYLDVKEQFSVDELLYALMVQSANDAATALAIHVSGSRAAFIAKMNETARELGMSSTVFRTEHGLPPSRGQEPDVTTARDMSILCRELVKRPETLKYTSTRTRGFRDGAFSMRNHNHLLGQDARVDGLKTGYYSAAGFSIAATARENGRRVITVVMGCADRLERDRKTLDLLREGLAKLPERTEPETPPETPEPEIAAAPEQTPVAAPAPITVQPKAEPARSGFWGRLFLRLGLGIFAAAACILAAGRILKARRDALAHY